MKEEGTYYEGNWEEQYTVSGKHRKDGRGKGGGGGEGEGAGLPKPYNNQAAQFFLFFFTYVCNGLLPKRRTGTEYKNKYSY